MPTGILIRRKSVKFSGRLRGSFLKQWIFVLENDSDTNYVEMKHQWWLDSHVNIYSSDNKERFH